MGFSVRGHICIRRKAKDGTPGEAGKSIRTTVWETGKQYYAGDTQVDGVYPLDIVADKAISIGVSGVNFYMCRTSHTSASNIPLSNTAYWTKLNNLKPVVTYLILAELIKANYIDVQDLAAATAFINALVANTTFTESLAANTAFINKLIATSAFIDNLSVKHLNGADGIFTGSLRMPFIFVGDLFYGASRHDNWWNPSGGSARVVTPYSVNAAQNIYCEISIDECQITLPTTEPGTQWNGFTLSLLIQPNLTKTSSNPIKIVSAGTYSPMYSPKQYDNYGMISIRKITTIKGGFIQITNIAGAWYITNDSLIQPTYSSTI